MRSSPRFWASFGPRKTGPCCWASPQGGGMTYRMGLQRPDKFVALVALSASLPDPEILRPRLPDHRKQPVFVAHGLYDQMVSMDSARRTREFLDAENYNLSYHEYNMGHEIPVEVLRDMVPWMEALLPPLVEETDPHLLDGRRSFTSMDRMNRMT